MEIGRRTGIEGEPDRHLAGPDLDRAPRPEASGVLVDEPLAREVAGFDAFAARLTEHDQLLANRRPVLGDDPVDDVVHDGVADPLERGILGPGPRRIAED